MSTQDKRNELLHKLTRNLKVSVPLMTAIAVGGITATSIANGDEGLMLASAGEAEAEGHAEGRAEAAGEAEAEGEAEEEGEAEGEAESEGGY